MSEEGLLLACAAATLYMVGLTWFVQVVHYPLFAEVGSDSFDRYHRRHSSRTALVVAVPMLVELVSSIALALNPPVGLAVPALIGALLAVSVWVVTLAWAAPIHTAIGDAAPDPGLLGRLNRANLFRSMLWTLHAVVVLVMLAKVVAVT